MSFEQYDAASESDCDLDRDMVLMRCKEAIERLHDEVAQERETSASLSERVRPMETELSQIRLDYEQERSKRRDLQVWDLMIMFLE